MGRPPLRLRVPVRGDLSVPVVLGQRVPRDRAPARRSRARQAGGALLDAGRAAGRLHPAHAPLGEERARRRAPRVLDHARAHLLHRDDPAAGHRARGGPDLRGDRRRRLRARGAAADPPLLPLAQGLPRSGRRRARRDHPAGRVRSGREPQVRPSHARVGGPSGGDAAAAASLDEAFVRRVRATARGSGATARARRLRVGGRHGERDLRRRPARARWSVPCRRILRHRSARARGARAPRRARAAGEVLGRSCRGVLGSRRMGRGACARAHILVALSPGARRSRSGHREAARRGPPAEREGVLAPLSGADRRRDRAELRSGLGDADDLARAVMDQRELVPLSRPARSRLPRDRERARRAAVDFGWSCLVLDLIAAEGRPLQ